MAGKRLCDSQEAWPGMLCICGESECQNKLDWAKMFEGIRGLYQRSYRCGESEKMEQQDRRCPVDGSFTEFGIYASGVESE